MVKVRKYTNFRLKKKTCNDYFGVEKIKIVITLNNE